MKNFFKDKTWENYFTYFLFFLLIISVLFLIFGFFWNVETDIYFSDIDSINTKTSVTKILKEDFPFIELLNENNGEILDTKNLFTLCKTINPEIGILYDMVILAITGFSIMMLLILIVIVIFILAVLFEFIIPLFKKQK